MKRNRIVIAGAGFAALSMALAFRILPVMEGSGGTDGAGPAAVSVEVSRIGLSKLTETVSAVGIVEAVRDVTVESETSGRIVRAGFEVGDLVGKGDTLAVVDDELRAAALEQAKAQAVAAETHSRKAARDLERAEELHRSQDVSDAELEAYRLAGRAAEAQYCAAQAALTAAERQLSDTRITAPVAGYVAAKFIETGEMVRSGTRIADIVDLRKVKVKLSIPESDVVKLGAGQPAVMELDSRPGIRFEGTVWSVGAKSESPTSHTYPVEVMIDNSGRTDIMAGMFARVQITTAVIENTITVPAEWLLHEDISPMIFVARGDTARAVPVTLGGRSGDSVRIVSGLREGDLVVSFGQRDITDGAPIRYGEDRP